MSGKLERAVVAFGITVVGLLFAGLCFLGAYQFTLLIFAHPWVSILVLVFCFVWRVVYQWLD